MNNINKVEIHANLDAIELIINQKVITFIANVIRAFVTLAILAIKLIVLLAFTVYELTNDAPKAAPTLLVPAPETLVTTPFPATLNEAFGHGVTYPHNNVDRHVQLNLKPELTDNLLLAGSYKAPRNKKCRKGHVCIGTRCVLTDVAVLILPTN